MSVNYKELAINYEHSGLSKKEFGKDQGMSSSMVSYYLKKAREDVDHKGSDKFSQIDIGVSTSSKIIKVITASGVTIEIPL